MVPLGQRVKIYNFTSIVSKKAHEEIGAEAFATDAVGTGPYELVEFNPERGTTLVRHEGYWGEKAKIANVECVYIADTTARTLALLSGDVDMLTDIPTQDVARLRGDSKLKILDGPEVRTIFFAPDIGSPELKFGVGWP